MSNDSYRKWQENPLGNNQGDPTGKRCPKNCGGWVVYNGNYFCTNWGYTNPIEDIRFGGPCDWALSHSDPPTPAEERQESQYARALGLLRAQHTNQWEPPLVELVDKKLFQPTFNWRRWRNSSDYPRRQAALKQIDRAVRKYVEENPVAPK